MRVVARLACLATVLVAAHPAAAWMRRPFEDAEVVARSDLIVVARLKADSVRYVPHKPRNADAGRAWEHHATLVVTEVIAGDGKAGEVPVVIHYGITPVVGGRWQKDGVSFNLRRGREAYPPGRIELYDHGSSSVSFTRPVYDAAQDNIWFLRKGLNDGPKAERPVGAFGIVDPEDVQPLALRGYFEMYRSPDAEAEIQEYVKRTPKPRESALRYLDHLEVRRAIAVVDVAERVDRLLPFYLRGVRWGITDEAATAMGQGGEAAGDKLLDVFDRPEHNAARERIIRTWGELRHGRAVPVLVDLLQRHDEFWERQRLKPGWWNDDKTLGWSRRREVYGETYRALLALGAIGDPAARGVIERTRTRWAKTRFENPQLVEACDNAIAGIARFEPGL